MNTTLESHGKRGSRRVILSAILVLAAAALFLAVPVAAHAAMNMDISYDPVTAKISVTITHPVDDPKTHYQKTVRVRLNGAVISDPDYKSQPDKDTFTLTYDVNAQAGDAIRVTAICNRGGTLEKTYTVPQPARAVTSAQVPSTYQAPPRDTVPPATQSPAGFLSLLGAAAAVLIVNRE